MLEYTKAVIIPGSMCAWGLQPSDPSARDECYRKDYWLVVPRGLLPFLTHMARPCPGIG